MSKVSFRLLSRNRVPMPRGEVEMIVGEFVIRIATTPYSSFVAVHRKGGEGALSTWNRVNTATIRSALDYVDHLAGLDAIGSPACVEDGSGVCVHPKHNHRGVPV